MAKVVDIQKREKERLERLLAKRRQRVHQAEDKLEAYKKRMKAA